MKNEPKTTNRFAQKVIATNGSAPSEKARISQVGAALSILSETIATMECLIERLGNKLVPIMRNTKSESGECIQDPEKTEVVPLAESIAVMSKRISSINQNLREMEDSIEL